MIKRFLPLKVKSVDGETETAINITKEMMIDKFNEIIDWINKHGNHSVTWSAHPPQPTNADPRVEKVRNMST
jgi:hypothetical protein